MTQYGEVLMAAGTSTFLAGDGASAILAVLRVEGFGIGPSERAAISILDTFDGRLAGAGLRLTATRRFGRGDLPGDVELVLAGDGPAAAATTAAVPAVAADVPAGPMRARVGRLLDVRVLVPIVTVELTRTAATKRNGTGKTTVTAMVLSDVRSGETVLPGAYLEIAELAGYPKPAGRIRDAATAAGLVPVDGSVVELAAASARVSLAGRNVLPGVPLRGRDDTIDAFRAVLGNLRDALVATYDGTVEHVDPEFLHDFRVAVRRTRATLSTAKRVIPAAVLEPARAGFAWLGQATGPSRDLDVYQIEWPAYVDGLDDRAIAALEPVRAHLQHQRESAHRRLSDDLSGARTRDLLDRWSVWLDEPVAPDADLPPAARKPLGPFVAKRIRRAHRTMIERGRSINPDTPPEVLHELRKDAKKLRYLIECFGGLYKPSARKPFVQRLKALQENLGAHQDAEVHAADLREVSAVLAPTASLSTVLAAGQLVERMEQRRLASRAEFAERFAAFDTADTVEALAALLGSERTGSDRRDRGAR